MDVLSPFICVLCHSDWLFHRESCPRLDVVHPGRAWNREKKRCVLRGWFRVWNDATRSVRRSCRIWRASWAVRREVCLRSWPTAAGTHLCCHSCVSLVSLTSVFIIASFAVGGWLRSRVVSVLDSGEEGPGFKSQPSGNKQSWANCSHPCLCSPSNKIGSSPLNDCGGNCRPGGK